MSLAKPSKAMARPISLTIKLASLILLALICCPSYSANFSLPLKKLTDQEATQLIAPYIQQHRKPPVIIVKYGYIHISGSRAQYQNFASYWQSLQNAPVFLVEILVNKKPKQMLELQSTPRNKSTRALGSSYLSPSQKLIGSLGQALRFKINQGHQLKRLWLLSSQPTKTNPAANSFGVEARAPLLSIEASDQFGQLVLLPGPGDGSLNLSFRIQPSFNTPVIQGDAKLQAYQKIQLGRWHEVGKPKQSQADRASAKITITAGRGFKAHSGLKRLYIRVHRINI